MKLIQPTEAAAPPRASEIEETLKHVSVERQFQIYGLGVKYSYPEESRPRVEALPYNTLVEVALPYCLYLPNGLNLTVSTPKRSVKTLVIFRKFWTERASGSSEVDLFTQDQVTYLAPGSFQSPNFPQPASSGPDPACTGTNIERDRETAGYFRYSRLRIFFDTQHAELGSVPPEDFELAQREAVEIALAIVNRILDTYRFVTKEDHVQRLGSVYVTDLYFAAHNIGAHGADFGHGIRGAVMNRPEREIDQIAALLATGDDLSVPELLFLDAEASLHANRLVLTVVHAFQALELFLGDFLERRLAAKGLDANAIEEKLGRYWRTKARLKELLNEATGHQLTENPALWDSFCTVYDQVRNRLIHAAREVDKAKAEWTLRTCRDVVAWLSRL